MFPIIPTESLPVDPGIVQPEMGNRHSRRKLGVRGGYNVDADRREAALIAEAAASPPPVVYQ